MAITISGTNGIVGAGFTLDASGASVTAGVGTFGSLNAPAAGLTGALPAISAANCTNLPAANLTGTLPAISGANLTGISAGVTDIDQWYLTTTFAGAVDPVQNNLSRFTAAGNLGSAMTVSSGIWTFPSTGFWRIDVNGQVLRQYGHQSRYQQWRIVLTTDNFSSSEFYGAIGDAGFYDNYGSDSSDRYNGAHAHSFFDVTNVSTHKVKFETTVEDNSGTGVRFSGNATIPSTLFTFTRLGDT